MLKVGHRSDTGFDILEANFYNYTFKINGKKKLCVALP